MSKHDFKPTACPTCLDGRIWWPDGSNASGFSPVCVWCDSERMGELPDDGFDHDAATVLEPKSNTAA